MTAIPTILALSFVTPALFYAGAAAVAAPILIHLFARRRFQRIRWAAMDFLLDAERRNRRRVRLEEWILLALRCLAVLFIALLVGRPFVSPTGIAAAWGGSSRTERVILLDDSFSMGYETTQGDLFARAKTAVRRLVDVIRREAPDDTITLLRMTDPQAPIESGTYLDDAQTETVLARLQALSVAQRTMDPSMVIESVTELLRRNADVVNAAVYIVSDLQQVDWIQHEASAASAGARRGMFEPLKEWAGDQRGLRIVFVNVGEVEAGNRAVVAWNLQRGQLVAGATVGLMAQIGNFSDQAAENLELRVSVGHIAQAPQTVGPVAARQTINVEISTEFPRAGSDWAKVELPPDSLTVDNVRYMAAEVASSIRVLIVNGEPSADAYDDEVSFLQTALRPEGEVFSGNEVVTVEEAELERTNLSGFHVVVLANVYRVSDPAVEALERYVRGGGGLMIFLGDQVDAGLYNGAMYREGTGLLPAKIGERVRCVTGSFLQVVDRLNPAMRGLSLEGDPLGLSRVPFFEYFATQPYEPDADADDTTLSQPSSGTSAPHTTAATAAPIASTANVLANFFDAQSRPAMIERSVEQGRVLLITTGADKEWHLWPDHPTFLPVVMELLHHVSRRGDTGADHRVGEVVELPLDAAIFSPDVLVRTPRFPSVPEVTLTAVPAEDGSGLLLRWPHTQEAGLYQFLMNRRDGSEALRWVAVNVDSRESDLSTCDEAMLRRALPGLSFEYIAGLEKLSGETGEARIEWWRAALVLAFLALMSEQVLAWTWGRKR